MKRRLAALAKMMDEKGDLTKARVVKLKPGTKLVPELTSTWRPDVSNATKYLQVQTPFRFFLKAAQGDSPSAAWVPPGRPG